LIDSYSIEECFSSDLIAELEVYNTIEHKIEALVDELKDISIENLESLRAIDVNAVYTSYQIFIKEYNTMKMMLYPYSYFGGMVNYFKHSRKDLKRY
jgi:hypothetical protein